MIIRLAAKIYDDVLKLSKVKIKYYDHSQNMVLTKNDHNIKDQK